VGVPEWRPANNARLLLITMPEPSNSKSARVQGGRPDVPVAGGVVSTWASRAADSSAKSHKVQSPGCSIEGVTINLPTLRAAHAEAVSRASSGVGFALFTMNLDHLAKIRASPTFRAAYGRAALVTADGWPVVWLANRRGAKLERTCGADLVEPICKSAAANGIPVFFIGPERSSQISAISTLQERHPGLDVADAYAPNISRTPKPEEVEAVARRVNASGARLCFVCMGAPKQELLVDALVPLCEGVGFLCVGAALDFISGRWRRAPPSWQRSRLEWLWRLLGDPKRLASRYLLSAYVFFRLALGSGTETS
jgi:N-acetylglucosaminyldiphosphoundecaprenol N-acetyl-beta-D-mannosaminyltransferase